VRLPPAARDWHQAVFDRSLLVKTDRDRRVVLFAASAEGLPIAVITVDLRSTRSAANVGGAVIASLRPAVFDRQICPSM